MTADRNVQARAPRDTMTGQCRGSVDGVAAASPGGRRPGGRVDRGRAWPTKKRVEGAGFMALGLESFLKSEGVNDVATTSNECKDLADLRPNHGLGRGDRFGDGRSEWRLANARVSYGSGRRGGGR
jgi:hypothetical protein